MSQPLKWHGGKTYLADWIISHMPPRVKNSNARIPGGVDRLGRAVRFFIRCRQSMSGRMDSFAPLSRNRTRRGMNEQASAWLNAIEGLPVIHERLKRVVVLDSMDALAAIKQQDGPRTLFYCDPPYLDSTRTAAEVYKHEMTFSQHMELLRCLSKIKGRFLLSGYRSVLYDGVSEQFGWRRVDKEIDNKSGKGEIKQKRVESIWMNY